MIPNGFMPSDVVRRTMYDQEGRLKSFNISRPEEGGVGDRNSLFATDAELFGTMAPFLRANKEKDAARRNYVIQPGGACIYFEEEVPPSVLPSRTEFPTPKTSFGHDSLDATAMVQGGVTFTTGIPSPRSG